MEGSGLLFLHLALTSLAPVPARLALDALQYPDESLHHSFFFGSLGYSEEGGYIVLELFVFEVEAVIGVDYVVDLVGVAAEDDGVCVWGGVHSEELCLLGLWVELDFLRWFSTDLLAMDQLFWHSMHLQASVQCTPSWKHSQYFFTQKDFRHEHPFPSLPPSTFTLFAATPAPIPWQILAKSLPFWLRQSTHLQFLLHSRPAEKHQQYSFMHLEFRQLHTFSQAAPRQACIPRFLNLNSAQGQIHLLPLILATRNRSSESLFGEERQDESGGAGAGKSRGEIIILVVKQSINKMSLSLQFQGPTIALLERQYPDIRIITNQPPAEQVHSLYMHAPNPQLSMGDLRFIAQAAEVRVVDAEAVGQRIHHYMTTLIDMLESNEACRLSWAPGDRLRGRERTDRINLRELETQINILKQLIEECKHGVTCKSDLTDLLNRRRGEIFRIVDDNRLLRGLRQVKLPQLPQNYEHLPLLTEESYEMAYESILQKLLVYQNAVGQFLRRELGFDDFQRMCFQLMRQDIVMLNNNKTNELVKYVWEYCNQQYLRFTRMRNRIKQLRHLLIESILRAYYIAFQAKRQIINLEQALVAVEKELLGSNGKIPQAVSLGRNSVAAGSGGQEAIMRLQNNFTNIFNYLTEKNESIFINLYERKLKKRVTRLMQIQDKLTHFFKIIFNPDYADTHLSKQNPQDSLSKMARVEEKFKQVWELSEQLKPMNEKQFKLVFQEIQRLGIFIEEARAGREWEYKLSDLQRRVMNEYLFDRNGQRKFKKDTPMERFAKSRVGNDRSFNSYEVNKDEVFEDTIEELNKKRLSANGPQQLPLDLQNINREDVWREGQDLIDSIRPEFGEQFMDLTNFKAYLLPKLIKKVEAALSRTQYGEQPLYLHLASLIENLNILPTIIKPQINEKKIDLIFFPKVNAQLFTTLKAMMLQHQQDLSKIYLDLSNNPIKAKNLPPSIKGFMENRLRYLHVLLENIDKLEEIALCIGGLNLKKISHDITSEATYNLILKLLLASKEIKAYQDATRDRICNKNLSAKALKLLSEYIYPNFLNSLLLVFENNRKPQSTMILQSLLELSEASRRVMEESEQYMDTIVRMMEEVVGRRANVNVRMLIQEYSITLRGYNSKAEELINECYNYSCINSDTLNRQRIRIIQFLELLYNGPRTTAEIIDQKSKRLQGLLAQLP